MKEITIKNLANELEQTNRQMTDAELEMVMELFFQKYGTASIGMCLNPRFLLEHPLEGIEVDAEYFKTKDETEEVSAWLEKEMVDLVDGTEFPDKEIDMDFMCEVPQNCKSHQAYGFNCKCIRDNFANPEQFKNWADKTIDELGTELTDLLPSKQK